MKQSTIILLILSFFALCSFSSVQAQLTTKKVLSLEAAKKLATFAETEALKNKWTMVIAIVDDGANLIYLEKMDNTQIGSIEVATQKAKTAISFKRPTKTFEERLLSGKTHLLSLPNAVLIEGGIPIIVEGQYIGAIGVSGGASDQDGMVAKAAIDAFAAH